MQHLEFSDCHGGKIRKARYPSAIEQSFSIAGLERSDHTAILTSRVSIVNHPPLPRHPAMDFNNPAIAPIGTTVAAPFAVNRNPAD